jgi:hypothetical protein
MEKLKQIVSRECHKFRSMFFLVMGQSMRPITRQVKSSAISLQSVFQFKVGLGAMKTISQNSLQRMILKALDKVFV